MIAFESPWFLAVIFILIPYAWLRFRQSRRDVVDHPPLQYAPGPGVRQSFPLPAFGVLLEIAVIASVLVGLAGPYREQELELIESEGIDVMLVLDISASMLAEDFKPNRMEVLRRLAGDFVTRAAGHRLGILVFAGDVFVQCPLTLDRVTLRQLLDGVGVEAIHHGESGGTAVGDAMLLAEARLAKRRLEGRDQAIVLITDGDSNLGIDPLLAARQIKESGIRTYFIGVGGFAPAPVVYRGEQLFNDDGSPYLTSLDDSKLQELATVSGGRYDRAADERSLEEILSDLSRLESAPLERRSLTRRESFIWIPSLGALILLVLQIGLEGWVRRPWR